MLQLVATVQQACNNVAGWARTAYFRPSSRIQVAADGSSVFVAARYNVVKHDKLACYKLLCDLHVTYNCN